ncbi:hypothetical protein [Helicobacter bilis]|uniref:Uncharacterized protein n=2 Tax=Helicobacter bilis TaxID=37372 RepID=A0A6D2CD91_9HELI|nr:hypothetical protein [Helicobacter bilis]EMZ39100.1 hypothetical protein C826_01076 [Helicobacter bilis WiWa]TLE06548.1 hypothetical protein LS77_000410 [Helicobacter bilis]TLE07019.1 hypothetical protein LS76_000670 [Helicobacter bilis]
MAEREIGTVGFEPLDSQQQRDQNYATLITTMDASEIIGIIGNASSDEIGYYQDKAFDTLFCGTEATTGFFEYVGGAASTAIGGAAGGLTAATLGTSTVATTTGGIFGWFATTTVATVAAPFTLVAATTLGGIALGYSAYKLIIGSAKDKGKEEHFKETKQQGRYRINPVRTFNPFVLYDEEKRYIAQAYQILTCSPSISQQDIEDFLKIFDANAMLNANLVQDGRKSGRDSVEKAMRNELKSYLSEYCEKIKQQYKTTNKDIINRYIAFVEVNNEYITPRVDQAAKKELLDEVQKGNVGVTKEVLIIEEFRAVFSIYKMLLNHSQNTSKQIELQKEKMYERAEELGATELFENILAEHRLVKLDETNYIRYLQEIVSVLDSKDARDFINELTNDLAECMLVDSVMEPYEKEIMQNIANTFSNLLDTNRQKLTDF